VSGIKMVTFCNQVYITIVGSKVMIKNVSIEINKLHKILCHYGGTHLKATASVYGMKSFGKLEAFESFTFSKANQKNTKNLWTESNNIPGERLYIDISLKKGKSFG
jgi:hypothetical protein